MSAKDEKGAFEAMMDEIEEDESDDEKYGMKNVNIKGRSSVSYQSQPKQSKRNSTNTNSNLNNNQSKNDTGSQYKAHNNNNNNNHHSDNIHNQSEIDNFGISDDANANSNQRNENEIKKAELLELKRWLVRPCRPNEPPLKLYVERDRGGLNMMTPVYRLYLEVSNNNTNNTNNSDNNNNDVKKLPAETCVNGRFLMYATKQLNSKTSSYLFSCEANSKSNNIDDRGM